MSEMYKSLNEDKKKRHREMHKNNTEIIDKSGIEYHKASYECYSFRKSPLLIDFYPSTGRWKDLLTHKVYKGGAHNFIGWLANQRKIKTK